MIKTPMFVTALGLFTYGQFGTPEMPFSEYAHLPAVGLLGFLLYWIIVKQQPRERKDSREHTERIVRQLGNDFKETQQRHHESSSAIADKIGMLAENCRSHLDRDK